jgi:hypothetical protein
MPWYDNLDSKNPADRRTAEGLLRLKDALDAAIPPRTPSTMLLATWNIREFESATFGSRPPEPIYYMAEIIDRFDVVAVQEVRDDLSSFSQLMDLLGSKWSFLLTDVTEGKAGNRERMAFLYNSERVRFAGLAGEVVLPPKSAAARVQLVRSPYIVGFKSGWLRFALCTAHILYGDRAPELPARVKEIEELSVFLVKRALSAWPDARNSIMLGDFNVFATTDKTLEAIQTAGFTVPDLVLKQTADVGKSKHYDQIAFVGKDLDGTTAKGLRAGSFYFYDHVYRDADQAKYATAMGPAYKKKKNGTARDAQEKTAHYRKWRTYQMSDHIPLWVEIPTDHSKEYLQRKTGTRRRRAAASTLPLPPAMAALADARPLTPPVRPD